MQETLYQKVSDPRYAGRPKRDDDGTPSEGSRHNRGAAVDVALVTLDGRDVAMPTAYDDFTERAHRAQLRKSGPGTDAALTLEAAMVDAGFIGLPTEWWHFDAKDWRRYELLDLPLAEGIVIGCQLAPK